MSNGRWIDGVLALALLAVIATSWRLECADAAVVAPDGNEVRGLCWLHEATGIDCPGCGTTRSMVAFFDGDLGGSFRWHPAGPLLAVLFLIGLAAIVGAAASRRRPVWGSSGFRRVTTVVALIHLGLGLVRGVW